MMVYHMFLLAEKGISLHQWDHLPAHSGLCILYLDAQVVRKTWESSHVKASEKCYRRRYHCSLEQRPLWDYQNLCSNLSRRQRRKTGINWNWLWLRLTWFSWQNYMLSGMKYFWKGQPWLFLTPCRAEDQGKRWSLWFVNCFDMRVYSAL